MSETPEGESEPTEVSDPENYVNHRRLKTIFDIRDDMTKTRRRVKVAPHEPNINEFQSLSGYRALVDSYVVECEPLLRRYKGGKKLLTEKKYGEMTIYPDFQKGVDSRSMTDGWQIDVERDERYNRDSIFFKQKPDPKTITVTGLLSVINLPDPLTVKYEPLSTGRFRNSRSYEQKAQIKFDVLDAMVRDVNNFLAEIGFEVDPEEKEDTLQI